MAEDDIQGGDEALQDLAPIDPRNAQPLKLGLFARPTVAMAAQPLSTSTLHH